METVSVSLPLDLSSLAVSDTSDVEITHPINGENLGITVSVCGTDSATFKKLSFEQSRRRVAKAEKSGKPYSYAAIPPDERDEDALDVLAACTRAWSGVVFGGKTLDCTAENAVMLYEKLPWLREQVDAAIGNRANFIKG